MKLKRTGLTTASALLTLGLTGTAQAALLDLSDTPLFITSAAKPNVLLILDNSGSMNWTPNGDFVTGADPSSKSAIARSAAKEVIGAFGGQFNMGLMSYHQKNVRLYESANYGGDIGTVYGTHWAAGAGNGGGLLNLSIKEVSSGHKADLFSLLDTEQYVNPVNDPLRNAGATPIEGTLEVTKEYFLNRLDEKYGGPGEAPPESCSNDYAILITDGLPTVNKDGSNSLSTVQKIEKCAKASGDLLLDAGVKTFVLGFALPAEVPEDTLDSIAIKGGTETSYNAGDADAIRTTLNTIFSSIADTKASRSAATANSGVLTTNSLIFQAGFDSGTWAGSLTAHTVTSSQDLATANWDAADQYPTDWSSGRQILTWNGTDGVPFTSANMTSAMQDWLNDDPTTDVVDSDGYYQKRVSYLRGTKASSISGVTFRTRAQALGDIVHSSPVYVGESTFSYPDSLQSAPYSAFKNTNKSRRPVVYVGANDGMLHAFDASADAEVSGVKKGGTEIFSYVPKSVFPQLAELTDPGYSYHPSVDGEITVGDAFWGGSWKTVLVGGLRGGGQGFYALDITDPDTVTEANASSKVLWEFSDENNKHMGYSYSAAAIVKMANGTWAAVFGNGYNNSESDGIASNHGQGVLYFINLKNGNLMKKIVVPSGSTSSPNGLATPAPVDIDGDHVVDYIYAGDLNGNLWKFDVSSSAKSDWKVANKSGGSDVPLFLAKDSSGNTQPLTTRPEVVRNSVSNDLLVMLGTGKYLELADSNPANIGTQSFYGVKDGNGSGASLLRADLVSQEILSTTTYGAGTSDEKVYRLVSNNQVDWAGGDKGWSLDLPENGEMVITNPVARNEQIIFSTAVPAADLCTVGGSGWFMELDFLSGGRAVDGVMDVDGDGDIDSSDFLTFDVNGSSLNAPVSGFQSRHGFLSSPLILSPDSIDPDNPVEYKFITGSTGGVETVTEKASVQSSGRVSWRQIH